MRISICSAERNYKILLSKNFRLENSLKISTFYKCLSDGEVKASIDHGKDPDNDKGPGCELNIGVPGFSHEVYHSDPQSFYGQINRS